MSTPGIELYSAKYFAACGLGGILSCGLTHGALTPLDLVKCNVQANPERFTSTMQGFKLIMNGGAKDLGFGSGFTGIWKGAGPTFAGYAVQGLFKFGLYEVFKYYFAQAVGEERVNGSGTTKALVYAASSASAEFFADLAYCPFEAVKVRVQTRPDFAKGLMDGLPKIVAEEGAASLYAGLSPLWARQIPYTVIKFVAFEKIATAVYSAIASSGGKTKDQMNGAEQMGVVFVSGYLAGILCGAVSHPADTMVSKINKIQMEGGIVEKSKLIYNGDAAKGIKGIGFNGLWAGFIPRVVMIGTLTGLQWFIYGAFKTSLNLPSPGDAAKPAK
eukprot:TRINITY_DN8797_c0_g1_i1.p2 TRINITY_DN8797_c0_g1~~TRINITY_DN8797_c0_g1_i1.p2  ORF type:complete len:330 (-),score=83.63 TRINITY_DN8797_c0_g1_i1:170-1159(-)